MIFLKHCSSFWPTITSFGKPLGRNSGVRSGDVHFHLTDILHDNKRICGPGAEPAVGSSWAASTLQCTTDCGSTGTALATEQEDLSVLDGDDYGMQYQQSLQEQDQEQL